MARLRSLLIIFLLCSGNAMAAVVVDSGAPVYAGLASVLNISGAAPGTTVRIYASRSGTGSGPCQGGVCLGILSPVLLLGEVITDTGGNGSMTFNVPATESGVLHLQPVQLNPAVAGAVTPAKVWPRKHVLMIGDSITEGGQSLPAGEQYTAVTAAILGIPYDVVQVGCGGATSADWSPLGGTTLCGGQFWDPNVYTARALPNLPADFVTIMLGTNDSTGFFEPAPITPAEYSANMNSLVTGLLNDGAGVVMLMSPPPMCSTADPAVVARLEAYRLILNSMCTTMNGVVCGPDIYTLLGPDDFAGCDVHPNGIGHEKIGFAVAGAIGNL